MIDLDRGSELGLGEVFGHGSCVNSAGCVGHADDGDLAGRRTASHVAVELHDLGGEPDGEKAGCRDRVVLQLQHGFELGSARSVDRAIIVDRDPIHIGGQAGLGGMSPHHPAPHPIVDPVKRIGSLVRRRVAPFLDHDQVVHDGLVQSRNVVGCGLALVIPVADRGGLFGLELDELEQGRLVAEQVLGLSCRGMDHPGLSRRRVLNVQCRRRAHKGAGHDQDGGFRDVAASDAVLDEILDARADGHSLSPG